MKVDLFAQFSALNLEVAAQIGRGEPITVPGVPPGYRHPQSLVAEGYIPGQVWKQGFGSIPRGIMQIARSRDAGINPTQSR